MGCIYDDCYSLNVIWRTDCDCVCVCVCVCGHAVVNLDMYLKESSSFYSSVVFDNNQLNGSVVRG